MLQRLAGRGARRRCVGGCATCVCTGCAHAQGWGDTRAARVCRCLAGVSPHTRASVGARRVHANGPAGLSEAWAAHACPSVAAVTHAHAWHSPVQECVCSLAAAALHTHAGLGMACFTEVRRGRWDAGASAAAEKWGWHSPWLHRRDTSTCVTRSVSDSQSHRGVWVGVGCRAAVSRVKAVARRDKPEHLSGPRATESSWHRGSAAACILPGAEPT